MFSFVKNFYYPSRLLSESEFESVCKDATVLEKDERGVKVLLLASGDILKIFRVKRFISGTNIYSYARRFCRNAKRLSALGVPTVSIKNLYHFENNSNTAVLYAQLEGQTLRQILHKGCFDLSLAEKLGYFLAELHQKGIHFHSLHAGNIVLTPNGQLGLIDISDLSIYVWPLFCNTRMRSFKRLCRYQDDIKKLGLELLEIIQNAYFTHSALGKSCSKKIQMTIRQMTQVFDK
jgi:hypothetical protein